MKTLLKNCDRLIRVGEGNDALEQLTKLGRSTIPPRHVPEYASLLRRAGDAYGSVGLLYKSLLSEGETDPKLWNQMQAEYGASLNAIGCVEQARRVLTKVDAGAFPLAFLYRAFTHLSEWDYAGARPHLEHCINGFATKEDGSPSYWQMVAMVNILSTDVFERRHDDAREEISRLLAQTERKPELKLLRAAVYELIAQHSIDLKFYQRAEEYLIRADADLRGFTGNSRLFIKKWLAIVGLLKDGMTDSNVAKLLKVRMHAEKRRHWETIRSLDLHEAIAKKSEPEFLRVLFGTPFLSYRTRIIEDFPGKLNLSVPMTVSLRRNEKAKYVLDLERGVLSQSADQFQMGEERRCLDPQGLEAQVLKELSKDIFRPMSLSLLYNRLHPSMNYQPGMNDIVKKILQTTQAQLTEQKIPLKISHSSGFVSIESNKGLAFLVRNGNQAKAAA